MFLCLYVDAFINSFAPFNVISHNIIFWVFLCVCMCMCVNVYRNNIKDIFYEIYITPAMEFKSTVGLCKLSRFISENLE